jgi:hypothetical protein
VPLAIGGLALALFTILHPDARAARDEANGIGNGGSGGSEDEPEGALVGPPN